MHVCRLISIFQRYFRPLDLDGGFVYAPPRRKTNLFILLMISLYHKCEYETRYCAPPKPIHYMTNTHHVPLHYPTITVHKQDSTRKLECQLTGLPGFDYLLDRSHTETDSDDARADDLTRRRYDKRPKTKSIQKAAERVIAEVRPSGSAGDSATARLWIHVIRLVAVRACACLGERSEPTCIRQAHARVPKGHFLIWFRKAMRVYRPIMQDGFLCLVEVLNQNSIIGLLFFSQKCCIIWA